MANESLSKNTPKLNLTRRQSELFQQIILIGNLMAESLTLLDRKSLLPKNMAKLASRWSHLMTKLALILIE